MLNRLPIDTMTFNFYLSELNKAYYTKYFIRYNICAYRRNKILNYSPFGFYKIINKNIIVRIIALHNLSSCDTTATIIMMKYGLIFKMPKRVNINNIKRVIKWSEEDLKHINRTSSDNFLNQFIFKHPLGVLLIGLNI
jgi:hypothetical protein